MPGPTTARAVLSVVALLALLAVWAAPVAAHEESPDVTLRTLEEALNRHDSEAAATLFAPEAVVADERVVRLAGTQQVTEWLQGQVRNRLHLQIDRTEVQGESVRFSAEIRRSAPVEGAPAPAPAWISGRLTARNGRIVALTVPISPDLEVVASSTNPAAENAFGPGLALGGGASVVAALALALRRAHGKRQPPPAPGRPALLADLRRWSEQRRPVPAADA